MNDTERRKKAMDNIAKSAAWAPIIKAMFPGEDGIKKWEKCSCECGCSCASCACETGACPCDESTPSYATYWGEEKHFNYHANESATTKVGEAVGTKAYETV